MWNAGLEEGKGYVDMKDRVQYEFDCRTLFELYGNTSENAQEPFLGSKVLSQTVIKKMLLKKMWADWPSSPENALLPLAAMVVGQLWMKSTLMKTQ